MMVSSRRYRLSSQYKKQQLIYKGLIFLVGLILVGFIFSFLVFAWFARDLPSPGKLSQSSAYSSIFYDRDGKVLYEVYKDKNRLPVAFSEIPDSLKKATISIEDKNFYKHKGISELGIIRAVLSIVFRGAIQGGSTITQQLIKNVLLNSSQTASRKIKEWILAVEVERRYTKDQILEMYLNEAPYGGNFYGVASAAQGYFGKTPKELSLLESAILAGLPQRPSYYSPLIGTKDAWKARTKDVLRRMREDGYISKAEEQENLKKIDAVQFSSQKFAIQAPHFVFYVKDELEKIYGSKIFDEGIKVKTTLNAKIQEKVEEIVKKEINTIRKLNATNAAVVVLDSRTNEILAMVGSYDYFDEKFGKFNAALGLRQPGSTVKPITYALAFEKGYTPATLLMDVKTIFPVEGNGDYIPVNYDGKFRGPIQLRFALGNSINIPAVKLLAMVGIRNFLDQADKMGLTTLAPTEKNLNRFGLSITLGGGEVSLLDLTSAFSVFARGGIKKETQSVVEVKDYKNKTIYKQKKGYEEKVLSPEAAFLISHILSDNNARIDVFGPNSYLNIPGKTVAVKTGTTDDKRDNWAVGYTKSVTVGIWVGNNDNSRMDPKLASGATGASSIWYSLMSQILSGKLGKFEDGIMDKPEKVKAIQIDAFLGGLPKEGYPTRAEYFIEGTEPKEISPFYKKLKISKVTGKLANDIEIKNGNYEEKEFIVISENDPVSTDGKNRWQEAINDWAKNQSDDKFKPPTEVSDASADEIVVSITAPGDKTKLDSNNVNLKAKITTNSNIKNIKLFLNNNEIKNYDENKKEIDEAVNLTDGIYEFKIKATNEKDKSAEATVKFGVNRSVD
jgi:penicillin-binding protein 1C